MRIYLQRLICFLRVEQQIDTNKKKVETRKDSSSPGEGLLRNYGFLRVPAFSQLSSWVFWAAVPE